MAQDLSLMWFPFLYLLHSTAPTEPSPYSHSTPERAGIAPALPLDLGLELSNVVFGVAEREMTVGWATER